MPKVGQIIVPPFTPPAGETLGTAVRYQPFVVEYTDLTWEQDGPDWVAVNDFATLEDGDTVIDVLVNVEEGLWTGGDPGFAKGAGAAFSYGATPNVAVRDLTNGIASVDSGWESDDAETALYLGMASRTASQGNPPLLPRRMKGEQPIWIRIGGRSSAFVEGDAPTHGVLNVVLVVLKG